MIAPGNLAARRGVNGRVNLAQRSPARGSRALGAGLASALLLAGLAGCESAHPRPADREGASAEGTAAAIPRMEARGTFFDGRIEAEVLLARVGAHWQRQNESTQAGGRREGGGGFSGRAGGFGGGRGGHHGGAGRGGRGEGGGAGGDEGAQTPIRASNLPGAALRLRLTNRGDAPVDVEVVDFNSSLGDFVVEPAKITLPPAKPVEAEPMISRLGVGAEEIPLTIRLRADGRSEQRVLTLRKVAEPPPEKPSAPPGSAHSPAPPPGTPPPP